jgi:hypothetical protein
MEHEMDTSTPPTQLDRLLAEHGPISSTAAVHLRHELLVPAPPDAVWDGLTRLRLTDLPLARLFVSVRYLSLRPAVANRPLLTAGPLPLLHTDPPRLAVAAGASQPWLRHPRRRTLESMTDWAAFDEPDWIKLVLAFEVEARGGSSSLLRSETLVWPTSPVASRRFSAYWTMIRPFAVLIRREMLRAASRLAERPDMPIS